MEKIVVVGGGGYARIVISILKKIHQYKIVGYTNIKNSGDLLGVKYLGDDSVLEDLYKKEKVFNAALGIGQLQNADRKIKVVKKLKEIGYNFPAIISPAAVVNEDVHLGEGALVRDMAVISTGTKIGAFTIIGTSVSVSYDNIIGDFVNISLGSNVGIEIKIGDRVLIGMASTVMNNITIGDDILIGASSLVLKDCLTPGTYVGSPAKKIK